MSTRVEVSDDVRELLVQASLDYDLSITSVMGALLEAAFRTRVAGGLILNSLAHDKVKPTRRMTRQIWESAGKHGYMLGEYTLTREGNSGRHAHDDDGWYIEGPGITRTFVGRVVRDAHQTATAIVGRIQPELVAS